MGIYMWAITRAIPAHYRGAERHVCVPRQQCVLFTTCEIETSLLLLILLYPQSTAVVRVWQYEFHVQIAATRMALRGRPTHHRVVTDVSIVSLYIYILNARGTRGRARAPVDAHAVPTAIVCKIKQLSSLITCTACPPRPTAVWGCNQEAAAIKTCQEGMIYGFSRSVCWAI